MADGSESEVGKNDSFGDFLKQKFGKFRASVDLIPALELMMPVKRGYENGLIKAGDLSPTKRVRNALDRLIETEEFDVPGLSEDEKIQVLLLLGELAVGNYDYTRQEDFTRKPIGREKFFEVMRERKKADEVFAYAEKYYSSISEGKLMLTEEGKDYVAYVLHDKTGVSVDEIKEMLEKNKGNYDEFKKEFYSKNYSIGICGDIHGFIMETAKSMGFKDSFILSSSQRGVGHIVSGFRDASGQIVFVDYETLIHGGTGDMRLALAKLEGEQESIPLVYFYQNSDGEMRRVHSAASEQLSKAVTSGGSIQEVLDSGILSAENALDVKVGEELSIELSREALRGAVFAKVLYLRNEFDPANAISDAYVLKIGGKWNGVSNLVAGGASLSMASVDLKQPNVSTGERPNYKQLFAEAFFAVNPRIKISKDLELRLAMVADVVVAYALSHSNMDYTGGGIVNRGSSALPEVSAGTRLVYVKRDTEIFLDCVVEGTGAPKDLTITSLGLDEMTLLTDLSLSLGSDFTVGRMGGRPIEVNLRLNAGIEDGVNLEGFVTQKLGLGVGVSDGDTGIKLGAGVRRSDDPFVSDAESVNVNLARNVGGGVLVEFFGVYDSAETGRPGNVSGGIKIVFVEGD